MRRNRLILTNRNADRTARSTLLNYLRFIKYISNAEPCECVLSARIRARARECAIPSARREHDERREDTPMSCIRACVFARSAIRVRVCTTAVHNV